MCRSSDEYGYLAEMIPHHLEAIAAARHLVRSPRGEMREFGNRVVSAQAAEVDQMRAWLRAWYPDRPEQSAYTPMMRDLAPLSGDALDAAFLADMIPHHMHAVMNSQMLLRGRADHEPVRSLAVAIRDTQRQEIGWMRDMQDLWFPDAAGTRTGCGRMM
jgi:uncharacterized protein (DUF305 family)